MYEGKRYRTQKSNVERFWSYAGKKTTNECWIWTGSKRKGYGSLWIRDSSYKNGGKMVVAHRYSYELHNNVVLETKDVLHHTCHNKACVNPAHLVLAGSAGKHTLDHHPASVTTINKNKTHCIRGHEFTVENTYVDSHGKRKCRACDKLALKKEQKLNIYKGIYKSRK